MQNNNVSEKIWYEWVKRADDDELNIKSILKHRDGTANMVGFLAQQMAEKYLKGLLVFYKQDYPKIHFLKRIATLLEPFAPKIFSLNDEFDKLSQLYVINRYPSDIPQLSWQEAEDAYAAATKIKEFAMDEFLRKS